MYLVQKGCGGNSSGEINSSLKKLS